jgi:uncharacterized protein (DUF305 family)
VTPALATASAGASAPADAPEPERRTGRRFGTVALALGIVAGLLLGYAAGWFTPTLTRPGDSSPEAGFARDMTTHHAQAVQMALIAYKSASDHAVSQLGMDIATGQQGEIGIMQTWLKSWGLEPSRSDPPMAWMPDGAESVRNGLMPGMATREEIAQLEAAQGRDLDIRFLNLMIRHHLGGVHMVDAILKQSDNPDVTEAAQRMKNTQQGEVTNMQALLNRLQ